MRNNFPVVALSMICLMALLAIPGETEAGGHGHHHGWYGHHHHHYYIDDDDDDDDDHYYYVPPPVPVYEVHHHHYYEPPRYVVPYVLNPFGNGLRFSIDYSRQF